MDGDLGVQDIFPVSREGGRSVGTSGCVVLVVELVLAEEPSSEIGATLKGTSEPAENPSWSFST